jgi:hypothetical protein
VRHIDPFRARGDDLLAQPGVGIRETSALVQLRNVDRNVHHVRVRALQPDFWIANVERLRRNGRRRALHLMDRVVIRDHVRENPAHSMPYAGIVDLVVL